MIKKPVLHYIFRSKPNILPSAFLRASGNALPLLRLHRCLHTRFIHFYLNSYYFSTLVAESSHTLPACNCFSRLWTRCGWPEIVKEFCIYDDKVFKSYIHIKNQSFKAPKRLRWNYLLNHEKWYEIWLNSQNYRTRCIYIMSVSNTQPYIQTHIYIHTHTYTQTEVNILVCF